MVAILKTRICGANIKIFHTFRSYVVYSRTSMYIRSPRLKNKETGEDKTVMLSLYLTN
jgi:hypothetical protein